MEVAFDHIAEKYDREFTYSHIGMLQRKSVWKYVEQHLPMDRPLQILELNCGTGEDAVWMARHGHFVLATDASKMMVRATEKKAQRMKMDHMVAPMQLAIEDLAEQNFPHKFDLVFSNFGGLNCVDRYELEHLSKVLSGLLKPNGRFIAVVMSNQCAWETAYFSSKLALKKAFRRRTTHEVAVSLEGSLVDTFYYSPKSIRSCFHKQFDQKALRSVGLFVPPSYLEPFFKKRLRALSLLDYFETKTNHWSWLAGAADHFLVDLQLKD